MRHIETCRTAALGGHTDCCDSCGHVRISYNSCRDRHCPKCQNLKKAEWLEARRQRLLPTPYAHVVFTLPGLLRPLLLANRRVGYNLLFAAASQTLLTIAADPKHLGAQLGFTAILHTWRQDLLFHPHLHCVVTAGGLVRDGSRWIASPPSFFLPVKVLAQVYRGKFLDALKRARDEGLLDFHGATASLADDAAWHHFLGRLYRLDWVVYAKPPFGGAEHVFRYLGRYTHRVAIANHRLLGLKHGQASFFVRDTAHGGGRKTLHLDALEFVRRFLIHVLPRRFVRIRHYGLLAARNVDGKLVRARQLLNEEAGGPATQTAADSPSSTSSPPPTPWWERLLQLTGVDVMACPRCATGRLVPQPIAVTELSAIPPAPTPILYDTS